MDEERDRVRRDFDRIARLTDESPAHYEELLLSRLPARCERALEIGCGTGAFTRRLAERARHVLAIDLSPEMIAVAAERSRAHANIDYVVADVTAWPFSVEEFDCAVSIATFHHLPFEPTLAAVARALAPGGVLLVHDLFRDDGVVDRLLSVPAFLLSLRRRATQSPEARAAWAEHGKHDRFMTLDELRRAAARTLPSATLTRHLRWRYSLVWRKPAVSS
jgi:SAM-dependent methyltransferase